MNEAQTRAEYIDPQLKESLWGITEDSKILREEDCKITDGKINVGGMRGNREIADYILVYKGKKIAVIEAKRRDLPVGEGVMQAKQYAQKLSVDYTYSTNGKEIYEISMKTGKEKLIEKFPTPDELWHKTFSDENQWKEKFYAQEFEKSSGRTPRYYQEIAVQKTLEAIAEDKKRILLTLATGTGKTFISFQIAWKLFHTRWNLSATSAKTETVTRRPRILFLADRNILADQAFTDFSAFPEDALVRISPDEIRKKKQVPTSGSIFFTIFQTLIGENGDEKNYETYPPDFFDTIVIDECHRGGANDEGNWRKILEYFSPAVQIGLTATPKRKDNTDTYAYFGNPVYIYSLKEGINDGFLTPFKVKRMQTNIDEYIFTRDDQILQGEIEEGKEYGKTDFNKTIEIIDREKYMVETFLKYIDPQEKTIVFCATQNHAGMVRDLINQSSKNTNPLYCTRVTANDGALGEQYLRDFQDNEKTIPTILTTSQKLSTGVDARNVRNIVLMRPVNSIIEFKQIVGRGTRVFDGKEFFTIYDFADAYKNFSDPEWDGEPIDQTIEKNESDQEENKKKDEENLAEKETQEKTPRPEKIIIKLSNGKVREFQHMVSSSFWDVSGKPISSQEFLENLFNDLPQFFTNEKELRNIWSNPQTRKIFLEQISELGYSNEILKSLQTMISAEDSDIYDVLQYISFAQKPLSRKERVETHKDIIFKGLNADEIEFITFVLSQYAKSGFEELWEEKLSKLLEVHYKSPINAVQKFGSVQKIKNLFFNAQKNLYTGKK